MPIVTPSDTSSGGTTGTGLTVTRKALAFNTPNLVLTGIATGYTPAVGDLLIAYALSISTAWNGLNPKLYIYATGADPIGAGDQLFGGLGLTSADTSVGLHWANPAQSESAFIYRAVTTAPLKVLVDNNAGGDPGSTQGVAVLTLIAIPAS